ncbi:MAG: L,D-transpeptidase family protein [Ktedonobacteraceae bacterium]
MLQVSLLRRFCTQCGTAIDSDPHDQHACPNCGIELHAISIPGTQDAQLEQQEGFADSGATIRVAVRPVRGLLMNEQPESALADEDDDKTVRASTRISSRIYMQAALREDEKRKGVSIHKPWKRTAKKTLVQIGCGVGVFLVLSLLVLGVTSSIHNPHDAQPVVRSKAQLDRLISQARVIGVPASLLQSVIKQEQQLNSSYSSLFTTDPLDTHASQNLIIGYQHLSDRVPDIVAQAAQQAQTRAQQDMQNFQTTLTRTTMQQTGNVDSFSGQFSQDQLALSTARTPQDYGTISQNAREGVLSLATMETAQGQLADFNTTIAKLKAARIDVTAMEAEYQNDLQVFASATQLQSFQNLSTLIDAQYQQTVVGSVQSFPYVSVTRLNEFETQIRQLKTYGVNVSDYQARLNADQVAVEQAKTVFDDLVFLKQIDADMASMHGVLVQGEARYLVQQYHQQVNAWAKAHPYYDSFDGHSYALDSGYMQQGIAAGIDSDLASAGSTADFTAMVDEAQNALFNLRMFETDYNDHTPYNQVHQTDLQMLNHYKLQKRTVLMISLVEQAMRIYQNGKLLRSFSATTGRAERPSPPGVWAVLDRKSPIIFQSGDPKGSPYWFPDTPINYAILYHYGGDYVHDAWWRESFGPGTQFPHQDAGGDTSYNFDGSHGCVNLSESDAAWVYQHTDWNTLIVIY